MKFKTLPPEEFARLQDEARKDAGMKPLSKPSKPKRNRRGRLKINK